MDEESITTESHYNFADNATIEKIELQGAGAAVEADPASLLDYATKQFQALSECKDNILDMPYPDDGQLYCNRTFDGWGCWNDTLAGTRTYIACPAWANDGFDSRLTAFKDCNPDGNWWVHPESNYIWSNYTTCINHEELARQQTINQIYLVGYSISLVFLMASIFIFFYFRQLRCTRITIHKHLFISFIIHNIVWIIHDTVIPSSPNTLNENGWACRLFHIFIRYILVCNYFWMFNEGLYLHTVLVFSFAKTEVLLKVFYVIGWGLPIIVAVSYGIVRALDPNENLKCWINAGRYLMVLAVPVVISLLANLIFLCNIVRVLITKMRATNTREDHHTRKAVRATLILVPLLGLQYILFPFRPEEATAGANVVFAYDIASAVFTSLQGLFVSLIFCFFNGEVIDLSRRDLKVRRESYVLNRTRSSMANSSIRSKYQAATPSPGSMRRPSQFYHQDSLKMHTPSQTPSPSPSSFRRPSHFKWQESLMNCPSPSPRTYRRASKIVEESPQSPMTSLLNHSSLLLSNHPPTNHNHVVPSSTSNNTNGIVDQQPGAVVRPTEAVSSENEESQVAL
ncbi:Calcitonin gene-related peptide type 1 receptor [Hypsibius exemplaris]|uniref:Calcitonin gene-related peptide type 1 receptor n=1 Tax=Hypsibius exemplaris TaxID=2072580 RepID=A0A1W0XA63_HYPEX|nr:Calcitonin gene-related peptide type 1 receptor [Hypsibius exemplaris]